MSNVISFQPTTKPVKSVKSDRHRNTEKRRAYLAAYRREYRKTHKEPKRKYKYRPPGERPFLAWDGEGVSMPDGSHRYTLLSCYQVKGVDLEIRNPDGIPTVDCLRFMCDVAELCRHGSIHVVYGGTYDCNMILHDMPRDLVAALYDGVRVEFDDYQLRYRSGKSLWVRRVSDQVSFILYDVVSFFQCSFVSACDEYLGEDWPYREQIIAMKARRGTFEASDADNVRKYNHAELELLIKLMNRLREYLIGAGIKPSRWDGPGAIAAKVMKQNRIPDAMAVCPEVVNEAARFAYAGGRFELIKFGHYEHTVYEYDINSAYPAALTHVPNLAQGEWRQWDGHSAPKAFGVYRVEWSGGNPRLPGPFWVRCANGTIVYATRGSGWYWTPEILSGLEWARTDANHQVTILDGWEFISYTDNKPFTFLSDLYAKRLVLKAAKDGAHKGLKLALNSQYGKTCQQVGWRRARSGRLVTPPFHQLEWAGYTTSYCRAKVFRAALQNPEAVIAFETDALFSSEPLDLPCTDQLGDWEETKLRDITYMSSGFYFATDWDGEPIVKTRGVDKGCITRDDVLAAMLVRDTSGHTVPAQLTRFYTMGLALTQDWDQWCTWRTQQKVMKVTPSDASKRVHWCPGYSCIGPRGMLDVGFHYSIPTVQNVPYESLPYPLEWVEDERCEGMAEYSALRYQDRDYDED